MAREKNPAKHIPLPNMAVAGAQMALGSQQDTSLCRAGGEGRRSWEGCHEQILGCSWTSLASNASEGQGC